LSLVIKQFDFLYLKERQEANRLYKGKKLKQSDKPKTFVPGEQIDKLSSNQNGFGQENNSHQQQQQQQQRLQPSKEDIEAIRVIICYNHYYF
jgi:hypothetical protein